MIREPELVRAFEAEQIRREPADYRRSPPIFEALWDHGRRLGALPPDDPLEGIEGDLRLAEALRVR